MHITKHYNFLPVPQVKQSLSYSWLFIIMALSKKKNLHWVYIFNFFNIITEQSLPSNPKVRESN